MTAVRNSSGTALASYSFDDRSRRTGLTYTNGAGAGYSYDTASRLLSLDNQTNNDQGNWGRTYTFHILADYGERMSAIVRA